MAAPFSRIQPGAPRVRRHTSVYQGTPVGVNPDGDYAGQSAFGEYATNVGPAVPGLGHPGYQKGRGRLQGYLNNPFTGEGWQAIGQQAVHAPLGGHLRSALQGQEIFGHRITSGQARNAERIAAAVTATGVGSWGLLEAIDALNGDPQQTPGTMQMV